MPRDFIKVNSLQGELVLSQVKDQLGVSITTKEMYFQKPHHTYLLLFEHILSMVPYQINNQQTTIFICNELKVKSLFSSQLYKVRATEMTVINRNGRFQQKNAEVILPLPERFLEKVHLLSDLTCLPAK